MTVAGVGIDDDRCLVVRQQHDSDHAEPGHDEHGYGRSGRHSTDRE